MTHMTHGIRDTEGHTGMLTHRGIGLVLLYDAHHSPSSSEKAFSPLKITHQNELVWDIGCHACPREKGTRRPRCKCTTCFSAGLKVLKRLVLHVARLSGLRISSHTETKKVGKELILRSAPHLT